MGKGYEQASQKAEPCRAMNIEDAEAEAFPILLPEGRAAVVSLLWGSVVHGTICQKFFSHFS